MMNEPVTLTGQTCDLVAEAWDILDRYDDHADEHVAEQAALLRVDLLASTDGVFDAATLDDVYGAVLALDGFLARVTQVHIEHLIASRAS